MEKRKRKFYLAALLALAFLAWTVLVRFIDVRAIGPRGSQVGFAFLNGAVHRFFGVHMTLYVITDFAGLVPVAFMLGFAILGLAEWIGRKRLCRVDRDLLLLGGFYILVLAAYLFFEAVPINHRPVLIEGVLEVSYPSSTTLLVLTVMPTAQMRLSARIGRPVPRRLVSAAILLFTALTVIGRLLSGVHWLTDIIGGALLSASLVALYSACVTAKDI
jgi:undecaprenyl-diphosphatase